MPLDSNEELAPPAFRRGHLHLKDSPILSANESVAVEQLLASTSSKSLDNNHSRAGRNAAVEFVGNRMETDLNAGKRVF